MSDHKEILAAIRQAVLGVDPTAEVMLYGSRARGDFREESDWDVLVVVEGEAGTGVEQRFRHALFYVELAHGVAISTMVKSREEYNGRFRVTPLYHNIAQDRIRL